MCFKMIYWTPRFILSEGVYFGKMWKFLEKRLFFRAGKAGLGKYCTGGYGWIGVYRVNNDDNNDVSTHFLPFFSWALPVHCTLWGHYVRGL